VAIGRPSNSAGVIMGATLELAFIGSFSVGASIPPDVVTGGILGVAFAITSGAGTETALLLGLPIATLTHATPRIPPVTTSGGIEAPTENEPINASSSVAPMMIGSFSVGASIPPDVVTGGILGVAFAITSGAGTE
jgi:fructoselysine and glucoselysine-specific PTS system IIC component